MTLAEVVTIGSIIEVLLTFILCLIGASIKDIYDTMKNKNTKVNILKIFISSLMSTMLVFSLSDYIFNSLNPKFYFIVGTIAGTLGFEIIGIVSNIKTWIKIIRQKVKDADISNIDDLDNNDNK